MCTRGILAPTAFAVALVNATLVVDRAGGWIEDAKNGDDETDMVELDPVRAMVSLTTLQMLKSARTRKGRLRRVSLRTWFL